MIRHFAIAAALSLCACTPGSVEADTDLAVQAMKVLSDDAMQGREVGTEGAARARDYIMRLAAEMNRGTPPEIRPFTQDVTRRGETMTVSGENIVLTLPGRVADAPILEIMAHYDHVGVRDGQIYNGADDNASGVGALLAILKSFRESPPDHQVNLIWFDGEERGLSGAYAYAAQLDDRPRVALNFDMIAQNAAGEIYAVGTSHTPALRAIVETAAEPTDLTILYGNDQPEDGANDWTLSSDHGPFHKRGLPFLYFGVADHEHYHQPSDTFETIPLETYREVVQLAVNVAHELDAALADIAVAPSTAP